MSRYPYKVFPKFFLSKVIDLYTKARKPAFNTRPSTIHRGRNHSIASRTEDLLAYFLSRNLPSGYEFYTDQPVAVGSSTYYPDILPVRRGKAKDILDVKTDLGWMRNSFKAFCEKKTEMVNYMKGEKCRMKDGVTGDELSVTFSRGLKYHIVVISELNIPERLRDQNREIVARSRDLRLYFLSGKIHPNAFRNEKDGRLRDMVNAEEFERLMRNLT